MVKRLTVLWMLPLVCFGQITWTKRYTGQYPPTGLSGWPNPAYNGYLTDRFDPLSGTTLHYGTRGYSGTVSVTQNSNVVNWVSGDKFSTNWTSSVCASNGCEIWLGSQTACSGNRCYVSSASSDTQLTLSANYTLTSDSNHGYAANATGIYSTDFFSWNDSSYTWVRIGGTGSLQAACVLDTPTMPGDRHPDGQFVIDTARNRLYMWGGPNQNCSGPDDGDLPTRKDLYYMTLNTNPASNTLTRIYPSRFPANLKCATAVYSPDDDVIYQYGGCDDVSNRHEIYCVAAGSPSSAQQTAGCTTANTWNQISTTGQPTAYEYTGMVYDSINRKVILFGGSATGTGRNETWAYDIPTKTWTQRSSANGPPVPGVSPPQPGIAFNPNDGKVYVHHFGATPGDYRFNQATNTWENLGNLGGPTFGQTMTFHPSTNRFSAFGLGGGVSEMWEGQLLNVTSGQFRILGSWPSGNAKWVEVAGIVPSLTAGGTATVTLTGPGGLSVPLTVQEALYSGATSAARTNEPFVMGVPLLDSAGITSPASLALTGAASTDSANMATDGAAISVNTGSGGCVFTIKKTNHNGLDAVTCGATAIISTSSSATRGLVMLGPDPTAGSAQGKTTCSPDTGGTACTTVYSSANDASSTASIEINGPVYAVVKATGTHKDASGNPYMQYTTRYRFYKGKPTVKVTVILRNANYDTSATPSPDAAGGTFNTAYKGFESYELRLGTNLTGTLSYTIANHTATPTTGTITTETAYIYQGKSRWMESKEGTCDYVSTCSSMYTPDTGYRINVNGSDVATGNDTQYPKGWFDLRNSSGVGLQIGMYQFAAQWPASLEYRGAEARIGIFSTYNTKAGVYQPWPQWTIKDLFLNFHTASLSGADGDFARFQHYLVARPARTYVNSTDVFPYDMPDGAVEDAYFTSLSTGASPAITLSVFCWQSGTPCSPDSSPSATHQQLNLAMYRAYSWGSGGGQNQTESRWSKLQRFYSRGFTGAFLEASHFYRFFMEKSHPHADGTTSAASTVNGFTWRSRPHATQGNPELNGAGQPNMTGSSLNVSLGAVCGGSNCWIDFLHPHWHGLTDYYMMTGDETVKESLLTMKDRFRNLDTYQMGSSGGPGYTRAVGIQLMSGARYSQYLTSIGDSDGAAILTDLTTNVFDTEVKPDFCVSGYPAGCTPPPVTVDSGNVYGISRVRGVVTGTAMRSSLNDWCTSPGYYRLQSYFQPAILVEGIDYFRRAKGSGWTDYWLALDLMYGISQWALSEMFMDDGTASWCPAADCPSLPPSYRLHNGFRYGELLDVVNRCPDGTTVGGDRVQIGPYVWDTDYGPVAAGQNTMPYFWTIYQVTGSTSWSRQLNIQNRYVGYSQAFWPADWGSYQMGHLIEILNTPSAATLQTLSLTSFVDNGNGTYNLQWTVPAGCQYYRVKYATKQIVDWIGFDPLYTNAFIGNPAATENWFAATNASGIPACGTTGVTQSTTVNAGQVGLSSQNFSVKAMTASGGGGSGTSVHMSGASFMSGASKTGQ